MYLGRAKWACNLFMGPDCLRGHATCSWVQVARAAPANNPDAMASIPPPAHRPAVLLQGHPDGMLLLPYGLSEADLQRKRQQLERVSPPLLQGPECPSPRCAPGCISRATICCTCSCHTAQEE